MYNDEHLFKEWRCALHEFGGCQGGLQHHHIIARSKTVKNKELRDATEVKELIAMVCAYHNVSKFADSRKARKHMLLKKADKYGEQHMRELVNGIPWTVQAGMTWEQLTG